VSSLIKQEFADRLTATVFFINKNYREFIVNYQDFFIRKLTVIILKLTVIFV